MKSSASPERQYLPQSSRELPGYSLHSSHSRDLVGRQRKFIASQESLEHVKMARNGRDMPTQATIGDSPGSSCCPLSCFRSGLAGAWVFWDWVYIARPPNFSASTSCSSFLPPPHFYLSLITTFLISIFNILSHSYHFYHATLVPSHPIIVSQSSVPSPFTRILGIADCFPSRGHGIMVGHRWPYHS